MYLRQLPALRAEEGLFLATAMALGSGALRPARAARVRMGWVREAARLNAPADTRSPISEVGIRLVRKDKDDRTATR